MGAMNQADGCRRIASLMIASAWLSVVMPLTVQAQSLDDELGVGKSDYAEASLETQQLWEKLLDAMIAGDLAGTIPLIKEYAAVKDTKEPFQQTLVSLSVKTLTAGPAPTVTSTQRERSDVLGEIERLKKKIEETELQDADLKAKKQQSFGAKFGTLGDALVPGLVGGVDKAVGGDIDGKIKDCEERLADYKGKLGQQDVKLAQVNAKIKAEGELAAREKIAAQQALQAKVTEFLTEMQGEGKLRPTLALANLWLKRKGDDAQIAAIAQSALDLQKIESKAIKIANAALKPAKDTMLANRFWSADEEIKKAKEAIATRITDPVQFKMIEREMTRTESEVAKEIARATKKRDHVMEVAERDASAAEKDLAAFRDKFPDYPEYDQDLLKIKDLKAAQVEAKFAKQIAAIEDVMENDTTEARVMIARLLASNADPDEVSILKARTAKLLRVALEKEVAEVRADIDEAQEFLTKFSVNYAEEIKTGKEPSLKFTQTFSVDVDNLVRARSLQAGAVKRLQVLLDEPELTADKITKSKLVGVQETAKAALDQMDGTLKLRERNKMIILIGGGFGCLLVLLSVAFGIGGLVRRKKSV